MLNQIVFILSSTLLKNLRFGENCIKQKPQNSKKPHFKIARALNFSVFQHKKYHKSHDKEAAQNSSSIRQSERARVTKHERLKKISMKEQQQREKKST
jgi:hypothetical protein